ncbi:ABC transporter permease [Actinomadura scrupuli]|uniref:ABC transporter permease n=1 Tax=Actinomadura scrupuli TaxID=559629 RepID=UPI003D98358D
MAEAPRETAPGGPAGTPLGRELRIYLLLAWTWVRAAAQYPVSMILLTTGTLFVTCLDLAAIALIFVHTPRLAGFSGAEVMFLYGTSVVSFAVADILLGTAERLGQHVREGTLDAILVRPVSPLIQIATEDFSPRRLGKLVPALVVLGLALGRVHVTWTPGRVIMLPVMLLSGVAIFGALWVLTAALQFVVIDAREAMNSVTYGGGFLTQYPLSVFGRDFVRALTFLVPLAFVNWQPALYILDRPDPLGLPAVLRFGSPLVAVLLCAVAALAWRAGLRRYRSTGS